MLGARARQGSLWVGKRMTGPPSWMHAKSILFLARGDTVDDLIVIPSPKEIMTLARRLGSGSARHASAVDVCLEEVGWIVGKVDERALVYRPRRDITFVSENGVSQGRTHLMLYPRSGTLQVLQRLSTSTNQLLT